MRILELQQYAQDNGFDSLKFKFTNLLGQEKKDTGKMLTLASFGLKVWMKIHL